MKISNETKVGALTAIAIVILIMGFNFLKGRNLTERNDRLHTVFPDIKGLQVSNPVYIKGLQVGKVVDMHEKDNNLSGIVVSFTLNKDINIPDNSEAVINSDLLGGSSLEIKMGTSSNAVKSGDTLRSAQKLGIMTEITNSLNPAIANINKTLASLDVLIQQLSATLDPSTKGNLQSVIGNLNKATANIAVSAASLNNLLTSETSSLSRTLVHLDTFTNSLAANSGTITSVLDNLNKTTDHLSKADIDGAINNLKAAVDKLDGVMGKLNSTDGTIGALLNSRDFYNNLNSTVNSLHILMDDLRAHPKRYVGISIFGKKDKGNYLTQPLATDSLPPSTQK